MSAAIVRALRGVRSAETQAISIYEAELHWIRAPERRALLGEILLEEREHDSTIAEWAGPMSALERVWARCGGWALGTLLAMLPWPLMCRVQAWAENEAARIYERAARAVERNENPEPRLLSALLRARDSERRHAIRFTPDLDPAILDDDSVDRS